MISGSNITQNNPYLRWKCTLVLIGRQAHINRTLGPSGQDISITLIEKIRSKWTGYEYQLIGIWVKADRLMCLKLIGDWVQADWN